MGCRFAMLLLSRFLYVRGRLEAVVRRFGGGFNVSVSKQHENDNDNNNKQCGDPFLLLSTWHKPHMVILFG